MRDRSTAALSPGCCSPFQRPPLARRTFPATEARCRRRHERLGVVLRIRRASSAAVPRQSLDAFYWASRLAPWSADPLYAQWVPFTCATSAVPALLDDDQRCCRRRRPRSIRFGASRSAQSVRASRNGDGALRCAPGHWGGDVFTRAWLAYANRSSRGTELFGRAISQKPDKFYRFGRFAPSSSCRHGSTTARSWR